jgi:hypothetical protein
MWDVVQAEGLAKSVLYNRLWDEGEGVEMGVEQEAL